MRILKNMLPLLMLLLWSMTAKAQYNPTDPPEPGVYFTLTTRSVPSDGEYGIYGAGTYAFGSSVYLNVGTNTGYRFIHWEDDNGTVVSTEPGFSYTMPARNVTMTARFVYDPSSPQEPATPEFKNTSAITFVASPSEAGYFYCQSQGSWRDTYTDEFEVGNTYRFTAYENTYYRFVNWTRNGIVISTEREFDYTVPIGDHTLVANFKYDPDSPGEPGVPMPIRRLSVKANPQGSANVYFYSTNWYQVVNEMLPQGFTTPVYANPEPYYSFVNWTDQDGNVVSETPNFDFTMPDHAIELTANLTYNYDPTSPEEPGIPNPDGSIGENMVMWPRFGMYDDTHVQILCETPGATIHYTLDGSTPTSTSPVYSTPVYVERNLLVRAIALKEGMEDSPVVSYQVTAYKAATPVFTFENFLLKITSDTPGAIIRYTTDFSNPTEESEVYTAPFLPEENCRIKAYASKEGLTDSPINIFVFRRADYTIPAPTFSFNEAGSLVITPSVAGGVTRYTLDGTDPTPESTVYTAPIPIDGNFTVKAYTTHPNYYDSPIGEYVMEGFAVERPTFSFSNPLLTITTVTNGAQIRYTLDGTVPTASSTLYTAPLRLTEDCIIVAKGFKENYVESDTISFRYVYKDYQLPTPTASFANKQLTLVCSDTQAQIRYTTDNSEPSAAWTRYEGPISLTQDCTVRFFAMRDGFNDSEVGTFDFVYSRYQVAKPTFSHDMDNKLISISTTTENAQIRYTTDGSNPSATTGAVYTEPIAVIGNMTFKAIAVLDGLFDSDIATYSVDDQKAPTPTATYARHAVTLECSEPEAQIHYTTDGSQPTASSTVYSDPIPMTGDCTVRFFASKSGYNDSDEATFSFVLSQWQDTVPTIRKDFRNRRIYMERQSHSGIRAVIDGVERICNSIDSIDVDTSMHRIEFTSIANNEDRYDSETITEELAFHLPPQLDYDGHAVHYGPADNDPAAAWAEASLFMGERYRDGGIGERSYEVTYMETLRAVMKSDHAFRSDTISMPIDYFNTGKRAAARNGHRLSECFGTWGDRLEDYTYLQIDGGEIEKDDLKFLGSLPNLTTLDLQPTFPTSEPCDSVFAGSRIETLSLWFANEGMLKGMDRLTTVMWGITNEAMPDGRLSEAGNPNILLWAFDADKAPADAVNVVVHPYIGGFTPTDPDGAGVTGTAERITLTPGYPFGAHMPIEVMEISLTKEFTMPTEIGVCAGWESLVLPFAPESILHENGDTLVPITAWEGPEDSNKPFWLYRANGDGWAEANSIEAQTPYIISMPNNEAYVEGYSLPGKVTFTASDLTIDSDSATANAEEWQDGTEFVGTFMPVEEAGIRSLNVNTAAGRDWLGSAFVGEDVTLPFGAYMRGANLPRQIPVFGDWSGVMTPTADPDFGIMVETPAPGTIRVSAMRDCRCSIVTPDGAVIRSFSIKGGESVTTEGLTRGLYICAEVKVMVK